MSQPIRVLHVIGQMDRGGAETMIMNLYREIDRTKIQFDFVVHTNQKCQYDDEIMELGGIVYNFPRFNGVNTLKYVKKWNDFFNEHSEYKIIHGHIGSSAALYLSIGKRFGLLTIAHSHSSKNEPTIKGKIYTVFSYPTRFIADYFLGCSKEAGLIRYGEHVVSSNKFKVVNNAIKIQDFHFSSSTRKMKRMELNIEKKFVIGHVGRFNVQKNHVFLIDIFKTIHNKNKNAVLLLVGDGNLRRAIEKKVNDLDLKDSVIFTGVRADIPDLLQAMDVFVFPSLNEGLGIVVVEAQATGLHCIVSDTIPEEAYVTDLVKSLSLNSLTDTWAKSILEYEKGYERKNNSKRIKSNGYDINDTGKWIEQFYLTLTLRE